MTRQEKGYLTDINQYLLLANVGTITYEELCERIDIIRDMCFYLTMGEFSKFRKQRLKLKYLLTKE